MQVTARHIARSYGIRGYERQSDIIYHVLGRNYSILRLIREWWQDRLVCPKEHFAIS